MRPKIRLGNISYLNTLPMRMGLEVLGVKEVFTGTPSEVNRAILTGKVDLCPVSSIFYAENKEKFFLLRNLCIAAEGKLKSVILLSRYPMEELKGKKVFLNRDSATSRRLLKILFKSKGVKPVYIEEETEKSMLKEMDASLLIGDDALKAYHDFSQKKEFFFYDLSEEWHKLTEKPMVFALWAVRRKYAILRPGDVERAYSILLAALEWGLSSLEEVSRRASRISGLNKEVLMDYYRGLSFYLSESSISGLLEFYQRAIPKKFKGIEFFNLGSITFFER